MLDSKFLRQDIEQTAARLAARGYELDVATVTALEEKRKTLQVKTQELQSQRNASAKAIGQAKAKGHASNTVWTKPPFNNEFRSH